MTVRALIFDVDGTLAETEEAHRHAFNQSFAAHDLPWHWTRDTYARLLMTTGGKERIRAYCAEIGGVPDGLDIAALHADKTRRYAEILAGGALRPRPGIDALLDATQSAGLRLAIATTTNRPNVDALAHCLWGRPASDLFEVIAAGDEVAHKKPAPDVYLLALSRLGLPASACLAFEDSLNGLRSALAAGLPVIVTPSAYTATEDFTGAAACIADLHSFRLSSLSG